MAKKALCITITKTVSWETYKQELAKVADGNYVMNYKVPTFPKEVLPIKALMASAEIFIVFLTL